MTEDEYIVALDSILVDLGTEAEITIGSNEDKPVIDPLSLIRMMIKYDVNNSRRALTCAVCGLILARLPLTDENIRWLLKDVQIGYFHENEMHQTMSSGTIPLFSKQTDIENRYKDVMKDQHGG